MHRSSQLQNGRRRNIKSGSRSVPSRRHLQNIVTFTRTTSADQSAIRIHCAKSIHGTRTPTNALSTFIRLNADNSIISFIRAVRLTNSSAQLVRNLFMHLAVTDHDQFFLLFLISLSPVSARLLYFMIRDTGFKI